MNNNKFGGRLLCGLLPLCQLLIPNSVLGQDADIFSYSAYVELGGGYSSNVDIEELEVASGESDIALLVDGGIDITWRPQERWRIDSGYNYHTSRFKDVDEFDLSAHMLYIDASYELDLMTLGSNYYFTDADLNNKRFLSLHQFSAYAGKMLNEYWYVRAALNFSDKNFKRTGARDAENLGFSVDGFWFFNAGVSSLNVGYDYEKEDTRAARYEYDAITLRALVIQRLSLQQREASLQLGYNLQLRDYDNPSPSIGRQRDDTRHSLNAQLTVHWADNFDVITKVKRAQYDSDLPSADYNETSIMLSAKFRF